ncbi:MAG: WG repeat-containing protein, partial [Chitinophagaceae bacterium]
MRKNIIRLFVIIICTLCVTGNLSAQLLGRDMEMNIDEFKINKSPVKTSYDLYVYYLLPLKVNGKFGFLNAQTGDTAISFLYDSANYFQEGLADVQLNGKWGFINMYGKQIVPCRYDSVAGFSDGICLVKKGN